MSERAASGISARRLVARSCAIWMHALRGATDGVIGQVVFVTFYALLRMRPLSISCTECFFCNFLRKSRL
jgi:hypothetical protein